MDVDFAIKQYSTHPSIVALLHDQTGAAPSTPIPLGSHVYLHCRTRRVPSIPNIIREAVIDDATAWKVHYDWLPGDTGYWGIYDCEWEVVYPDGSSIYFPSEGYFTMDISEAIAHGGP